MDDLRKLGLEITASKVAWDDKIAPPPWLPVVNVLKKEYWQNDDRTFIFMLPDIQELTNEKLAGLVSFLGNCHLDEFSQKRVHHMNVFRLYAKWWSETFGL